MSPGSFRLVSRYWSVGTCLSPYMRARSASTALPYVRTGPTNQSIRLPVDFPLRVSANPKACQCAIPMEMS
jgi:hypothetical protein